MTKTQYSDFVGESQRIDSAKNERLKALNKSKELALQTPGVERCVAWQGYLENGKECSKANISTIASGETSTVTSNSVKNTITESSKNVLKTDTSTAGIDSVTVTVKAKNEFENYLYSVKDTMEKEPYKSSKNAGKVNDTLSKLQEWVDSHPNEDVETYKSKQKELENTFELVLEEVKKDGPNIEMVD